MLQATKKTLKSMQLCPDFLTTELFHITKYTNFWSSVQQFKNSAFIKA